MTKLRWLLLAALAVVSAAALRLSGRPIMETSRALGVPDDGSLWTAVVMVEGAQLILTALWLHPATSRAVRTMAALGTGGCLVLSAGAGWSQYGPVGVVPALLYAGLVHILSRDLLAGSSAAIGRESAGYVANPQVASMSELANQPAISHEWGGPDAVTAPTAVTPAPAAHQVTAPAKPRREAQRPLAMVRPPRRGQDMEHVPGWQDPMVAVARNVGEEHGKWMRRRAAALGMTQAGRSGRAFRWDVETAELARATAEAVSA